VKSKPEVAAEIYRIAHLTGEFELRSGAVSNEYFDKYRFESNPTLLGNIADLLAPLVPTETECLAGLEMGGIPVVTMLSQRTGLPAIFVRKTAKEYGTRKLAEGLPFENRRCLIVEDVVTSGGQIVLSTEDLRQAGAQVSDAVCVIDRQAGGAENLSKAGIKLHALLSMQDLLDAV